MRTIIMMLALAFCFPVFAEECPAPEIIVFTPGDIRLAAGIEVKLMEKHKISSEQLRAVFPLIEAETNDIEFVREINRGMTADLIVGRENLLMRTLTQKQFTKFQRLARSVGQEHQQCLIRQQAMNKSVAMKPGA